MSEPAPSNLSTNAKAHKLITENHVKAALISDKGPDVEMNFFEIIDFTSKGDNYVCFVTSVKVVFVLSGHQDVATYIVKLNPCSAMESVESFIVNVFLKESEFYLKMAPELNSILVGLNQPPLRLPLCLYASNESKREIIILEDMRPKGFKMYDRMKCLDEQHSLLVIEELARLHSSSVILQETLGEEEFVKKFDFLDDLFLDTSQSTFFKAWFQSMIANGCKVAAKLTNYDEVETYLAKLAPNGLDLVMEMMTTDHPFKVVCHGDCWNNNILFRYKYILK